MRWLVSFFLALCLVSGAAEAATSAPPKVDYAALCKAPKTPARPSKLTQAKQLLKGAAGVTRDETRGLAMLKEILPENPKGAGLALGDHYQAHGKPAVAERYYRQAAAAGNSRAYLRLAALHPSAEALALAQDRVMQDVAAGDCGGLYAVGAALLAMREESAAEAWLEAAVQAGDVLAMPLLAERYEKRKATEEAIALWRKMVDAGVAGAENYYRLGQATEDPARAFRLFEQAAMAGQREALVKLGNAYQYGEGVAANPLHSYRYYRLAAAKGSRDAMLALEENYRCGVGRPAEAALAERWRQRAAWEGPGMPLTGKKPESVKERSRREAEAKPTREAWERAARYHPCDTKLQEKILPFLNEGELREKAERGDAAAMRMLARRTMAQGKEAAAIGWYERAAAAGDVPAMQELGNAYFLGVGVKASKQEAEAWWRRAEE